MKPPAFAYVPVTSVREAIAALERYGADARILAGGQSLLQVMNMRRSHPKYLVDINQISELDYIRERSDGLAIGALTRHRTIERSEVVQRVNPLLCQAVRHIGHVAIRTRGTIGGSLVQHIPGAEYSVVARLLDAEILVEGPDGQRTIAADQFFVGRYATAVQPDEVVLEVRLPSLPKGAGSAFVEFSRRHDDPAIVSAAASVELNADGTVKQARIALGNVYAVPYLVSATTRFIGRTPDAAALAELEQAITNEVEPEPDAAVSASYKKHLAGVLSRRAYETATRRSEGGQ